MTPGTLYGIGVGPGDPEWITLKAVRLLSAIRHICVPRSRIAADSRALDIARPHLRPDSIIHEITFPMSSSPQVLHESWQKAATEVHQILLDGQDCCFLTLGDSLLYSTYIYLLRELLAIDPQVKVQTVPGITAFSAAAALTDFAIGEGKQNVTIVPAADDLAAVARALDGGGTVVLMKVGDRLERILDELESRGLLGQSVFASHVGMPDQFIETDLRRLRGTGEKRGYLSIILVHGSAGGRGSCRAESPARQEARPPDSEKGDRHLLPHKSFPAPSQDEGGPRP